jgi:hypothetical protein
MMNGPPHPGPHEPAGVPVISETREIFDGSVAREVMSKILPRLAFGQDLRIANQVITPRAVELVVVDYGHATRVPIRIVRDVPDEFWIGGVVDVQDRCAIPLFLARNRIHLGLGVPEALVMTDVHPTAIGGI